MMFTLGLWTKRTFNFIWKAVYTSYLCSLNLRIKEEKSLSEHILIQQCPQPMETYWQEAHFVKCEKLSFVWLPSMRKFPHLQFVMSILYLLSSSAITEKNDCSILALNLIRKYQTKSEFLGNIRKILPNACYQYFICSISALRCPSLRELLCSVLGTLPTGTQVEILKSFTEKLSFNDDQIRELEMMMRDQSASSCWWEQRIGRLRHQSVFN